MPGSSVALPVKNSPRATPTPITQTRPTQGNPGSLGANCSFLRAGLIDELSLVICPAVDGAKGAPSVFDSGDEDAGAPAPVRSMTLESSQVLQGAAVWLRYRLQSG